MSIAVRAIAAALALALPCQAIAAKPECLTRAELRTAIDYVMPALVKGVVARCRPALAEGAFLVDKGDDVIARYAGEAKGDEEAVRALLSKFVPDGALKAADAQSTATLIETIISIAIQGAVKPESCADISEAMALIDPLPAANMNALIEFAVVKVEEGNARKAARSASTAKGGKPAPTSRGRLSRERPLLCAAPALPAAAGGSIR